MVLSRLYRRLRYARKSAAIEALNALYNQKSIARRTHVDDTKFVVIDCEMTGLNPVTDKILSIAWVVVQDGFIEYRSAQHHLCYASEPVGDSMVVHGLSDQCVAGAGNVTQALGLLMNELAGAVAVFHHARLDLAFLQKVARENYGCPMMFDYVDTMVIERALMEKQGSAGAMQLEICRERYGLPKAHAHNALSDAIATAELLCAQINALHGLKSSLGGLKPRLA